MTYGLDERRIGAKIVNSIEFNGGERINRACTFEWHSKNL